MSLQVDNFSIRYLNKYNQKHLDNVYHSIEKREAPKVKCFIFGDNYVEVVFKNKFKNSEFIQVKTNLKEGMRIRVEPDTVFNALNKIRGKERQKYNNNRIG